MCRYEHQVSSTMGCNRKWQNVLAIKHKNEVCSLSLLSSISGMKGAVLVAANTEFKDFFFNTSNQKIGLISYLKSVYSICIQDRK